MKYEMIILDVDGTLCDIVNVFQNCLNDSLKDNNIDEMITKETIKSCQGLNDKDYKKKSMPFLNAKDRDKVFNRANELKMNRLNGKSIYVYPNVKDTIKLLSQKYKITIVSNCGEGYIEKIMDIIGIKEYIIDFIPASAYHITKDEAIQLIMKRNNVTNAVYVGDTALDQIAAEKANIDFIYANYGFGKNVQSKYFINEFQKLLDLLN